MIALDDAARSLDCQDGLLTIPGAPLTRTSPGAPHSAQRRAHMSKAFRWILLSAAVLALALALQPASAADVKMTLWRLKTYIPPADKILDTSIQECGKKIGAEVTIQTYTFDDMWTKYTAAIESKTLPDVAELDAVGPARLANLGRLSDVSDLVGTVTKELGELASNAEGAVKFGGKFYAVPHYAIPLILFYRKDLLEKVGVQPPDTWDAINEASVKIKVVTPAYLTDKTSAFDYLSWSGSGNNEAFMAGKIAFTPNGPSILFQEDSTKHPLRKDTAIKIMPKGPAGRNLALTFVMNWGIPVDGKQQKEARALVACLMSKEKFTTYMTGSFQQAVPLFKSLINHEYWNTPDGKVIAETVKLGRPVGWPGPTTPAAAEVVSSNVLTDMMTRVIVDKVTPEKAVEEADKRIKEIYDRLPVK